MFANIVAAALIGAVGGGLGGLLGGLLDKVLSRGKPAAKRKYNVGAVVGVVVGMGVLNTTDLRDRLARVINPPSRAEAFGQDLLSIPKVRKQIHGKTPQEVQVITQRLSAAGMLKLDDTLLVKRAQLVSQMLASADERVCGGFAAGSLTGDDFMKMMAVLSEEQRAWWFKVIRSAVEAEVGATPVTPQRAPTEEQIATAMAELQTKLSKEDQPRFANNLGALAGLPPAEACWTIRLLYSLVSNASGTTQATAARALMMQ